MFSHAVILDLNPSQIEPKYLNRIKAVCRKIDFISLQDKALLKTLATANGIFCTMSSKVDKSIINAAPQLKYIGVLGTGYPFIDAGYARSKNITVSNLGGYSTEAVAEFFFAVLLEHIRKLEDAKNQARQEDYSFDKFMGLELKGKTLGLIGAGRIGSRIGEIAHGFGMKVIYFSRHRKPDLEKLGAQKKSLDTVLRIADVLAPILVSVPQTKGILSQQKLDLLKPGCLVISLAPPDLIDQEAILIKAQKGELTFIFDHSDDLDPKLASRFLACQNCVVYPPIGFRTKEANTTRWETFVTNIEQFTKGTPQNVVN